MQKFDNLCQSNKNQWKARFVGVDITVYCDQVVTDREIWLKWTNKKMTKRAQSKQRAGPCLHFVATRKEFAPLAKKGCINVLEILFKVGLNTFPQYLAFHNPCDTMPTLT